MEVVSTFLFLPQRFVLFGFFARCGRVAGAGRGRVDAVDQTAKAEEHLFWGFLNFQISLVYYRCNFCAFVLTVRVAFRYWYGWECESVETSLSRQHDARTHGRGYKSYPSSWRRAEGRAPRSRKTTHTHTHTHTTCQRNCHV